MLSLMNYRFEKRKTEGKERGVGVKGDIGYLADSSTLLPPGSWVLPRDFCEIPQAKTRLSFWSPLWNAFFQNGINGLRVHFILFEALCSRISFRILWAEGGIMSVTTKSEPLGSKQSSWFECALGYLRRAVGIPGWNRGMVCLVQDGSSRRGQW